MKALQKFFTKLSIFLLPFALFSLFAFGTALYTGEGIPHQMIFSLPYDAPIVYLPAWQEDDYPNFKLAAALAHRPELMVIGSSRSEHIPHQVFNRNPDAFYNAGINAARTNTIWQVLRSLHEQDAMPSVLILVLDYPNFNGTDRRYHQGGDYPVVGESFSQSLAPLWDGTGAIARSWLGEGNILWNNIINSRQTHIQYWGLTAIERNFGYRPDGSIYNARIDAERIEEGVAEHETRLAEQRGMYAVGDTVREETMQQIEDILRWAQEDGSTVVAYFPPYRSNFYNAMMNSENYSYIPETNQRLSTLFAEYDYPFFNFSDISMVGGTDEEMYDGWHPSQLLDMRIILEMSRQEPEIFAPYLDGTVLEAEIAAANDPFYIFVP